MHNISYTSYVCVFNIVIHPVIKAFRSYSMRKILLNQVNNKKNIVVMLYCLKITLPLLSFFF